MGNGRPHELFIAILKFHLVAYTIYNVYIYLLSTFYTVDIVYMQMCVLCTLHCVLCMLRIHINMHLNSYHTFALKCV